MHGNAGKNLLFSVEVLHLWWSRCKTRPPWSFSPGVSISSL